MKPTAKGKNLMSIPIKRSLFSDLPATLAEEQIELWLTGPTVRLERILSFGQTTPEGEWYDQDAAEWVAVLQGGARLVIEGQDAEMELWPGDTLLLPAHCRHRVTWTDPSQVTVWLALHITPQSPYL